MLRGRRSNKGRFVMRFRVFKILSLFFFAMLILLLCSRMVHGSLAPDFTLTDIDGNTFALNDFRGKVVILDFFARYCSPCRTEMSHLRTVQDEFGSRLVIVSISVWVDDTDEKLRQFREEYNIIWIVARDTENLRQEYDVTQLPVLFIVDQEGYIGYHHVGLTESSVLEEEVNDLLTAHADVNGDGNVNMFDILSCAASFGSQPEDSSWNSIVDLNQDGIIDIVDIGLIAIHFGEP